MSAAERAASASRLKDPATLEIDLLLQDLSRSTDEARLASASTELSDALPPLMEATRWAASGAQLLCGEEGGPPVAPRVPVASRLTGAAAVFALLSGQQGRRVQLDGPALLGERAALRDLVRRGRRSAGGASRLLRTSDGWLVVTLPRPEDVELVPAWLQGTQDSWEAVASAASTARAIPLADRGQELGLAVAVVPQAGGEPDAALVERHGLAARSRPWVVTGTDGRAVAHTALRVVDLSALWAGPLCANLLGLAGADVVKVESTDRPDGARFGDPDLFALLNGSHARAVLDFRSARGRQQLGELIAGADVVVTSARPRALHQLGFSPAEEVRRRSGLTWVAITGYGLTGPWSNRAGYGDDASAAGGLVVGKESPLFFADAAADPATGLYAAIAALACAQTGGGLVDISLREVARHLARDAPALPDTELARTSDGWVVTTAAGPVPVAPPRARRR